MAYGVKYRTYFDNQESTKTYRVDILKDGYASTITEIDGSTSTYPTLGANPLTLKCRGSKDNLENVLYGTEAEFTFITDGDNLSTFNDLFTAKYKQFKGQIYDGSTLIYEGYLKPNNTSRNWLPFYYEITLSFNDGLADLKQFKYDNSDDLPYADTVSILTVIKRCITEIGINLDFKIQLNTWEKTLTAADECAFENVTVDNRRFIKLKDGNEVAATCYDVLQEVLRPFNCTLRQTSGYWWIINYQEYDSYVYEFDYATLTEQSRSLNDLEIDIEAYNFTNKGSLNLIEPKKQISVTFQNRTGGDNEISNGTFDSNITGWQNGDGVGGDAFDNISWDAYSGGTLKAQKSDTTPAYIEESFGITSESTSDKLYVYLKIEDVITTTGEERSQYYIEIERPDGTTVTTEYQNIADGLLSYGPFIFTASQTGTYYLRIWLFASDGTGLTNATWYLDDIRVFYATESDPITVDQIITLVNSDDGIGEIEGNILFSDSIQSSDLGGLKVGGTLTSEWNRYNKTDEINLQILYALQILNNYQSYKEYTKVAIRDPNDNLTFKDVLGFDSKVYQFVNFSKSFKSGIVDCEIVEILNADVTYTQSIKEALSQDGISTGGSSSGTDSNAGGSTTIINTTNVTGLESLQNGSGTTWNDTAKAVDLGGTLDSDETITLGNGKDLIIASGAGSSFTFEGAASGASSRLLLTAFPFPVSVPYIEYAGSVTFGTWSSTNFKIPTISQIGTKLGFKELSTNAQSPSAGVDGYVLYWDNSNTRYDLKSESAGWALSGTSTLTGNTTIDGDAYTLDIITTGIAKNITLNTQGLSSNIIIDADLGSVNLVAAGAVNYNGDEIATLNDLDSYIATTGQSDLTGDVTIDGGVSTRNWFFQNIGTFSVTPESYTLTSQSSFVSIDSASTTTIASASGTTITADANNNVSLSTSGTGKAFYNANEIATVNDVGWAKTGTTTLTGATTIDGDTNSYGVTFDNLNTFSVDTSSNVTITTGSTGAFSLTTGSGGDISITSGSGGALTLTAGAGSNLTIDPGSGDNLVLSNIAQDQTATKVLALDASNNVVWLNIT